VAVPISLEFRAVALNIVEEEGVEEPNVMGVVPIEVVKPLKAGEEGPPATGKVAATFKPQPLNSCVICGTVDAGDIFQSMMIATDQDLRSPHE
jgi:hypothetical protein